MNIVTNLKEWHAIRNKLPGEIGFIPTMGNLHLGHLSLCQRSKIENEITIVSIFINPTQFNQPEDFQQYPRTLEKDKLLLSHQKIDYLLLPDTDAIYADHHTVQIIETELSEDLEGKYRPGHFSGMLTIVLKLFNLVRPHRSYFGEKDYQQLLLVKKMVESLFLPIKIIACETIREKNGLALSSRNSRLNQQQREKAAHFPRLLNSQLDTPTITHQLELLGFKVDYITKKWERLLGAVWLDEVRLIDNIKK